MLDAIKSAAIWWARELYGVVPESLTRILDSRSHSFVCDWGSDTAKIQHVQGMDQTPIRTLRLSDEVTDKVKLPAARGLAKITRKRPTLAVRLSAEHILKKRVRLPRAGEADLKDIVQLQIERQTPFARDAVLFDFDIVERDDAAASILVEFAVVPKKSVEECLSRVRDWGLVASLVVARGENADAETEHVFYRRREAATYGRAWHFSAVGLILIASALLGALIYLPFERKQNMVMRLATQVEEARENARIAQQLRGEIDELVRDQRRLISKKLEAPTAMQVLNEITRLIPNDAWLFQLDMKDKEVQIQGHSPASSSLIAPIEESPYFKNATFRSRVTRDPQSGLERFHLSIVIERAAE